jgi:hypothetical protein
MALFVFFGGLGISLTVIILYRANKQGNLSHHQHALIVSIGMGITWMVAPLVVLMAPLIQKGEYGFIYFWIGHSLIIAIALYFVDRLYLRILKK